MFRALCCLVTVLCLTSTRPTAGQSLPGQLAPDPSRPARDSSALTGTAVITGRVVDAANGQPVRRARVHAASPAVVGGRTTYTGADGSFTFRELPPGAYAVTVTKVGWVNGAFGQQRAAEAGKAFDVAAGATVGHVDIAMARGGVIAGRITDEFGDPLTNTAVAAMRYQAFNGARRLVPVATRLTNDVGDFRIFGLAPGQYFLSATLRNAQGMNGGDERGVYAATYYPGTPSVASAQALTIAQGQTITGSNMMLLPVWPVHVSGTVISATGQPVRNASVMAALRLGLGTIAPVDAGVRPDGSFTLSGLSAGDYILRARGGPSGETAAMPLTVGSSDMTGVQLVTSPPVKITGRVIVDPAELGTLKGSAFRLGAPAASLEETNIAGGAAVPANDDFTFELPANPGHVFIRSNTTGWFLRSVKVHGTEILDTGMEVRANEAISDVDVMITHKQPEVGGIVKDAAGEATRSSYVIVFPRDPAHWGYLSRYVRMGRPNPLSKYRIQIPPGDYYVIALDFVEAGEWSEPDFLERHRERAIAFSLQEGEKKTLDLTTSPATPQP
jgi:protocatechuate 3,4-dioxygenase beta subunit